ncbi:MAG: hypothetical protein GY820_30690 [Gammaproteobacteria bacterium]|nr:hypothetical protein [Gammaproteobacteria bacterium]
MLRRRFSEPLLNFSETQRFTACFSLYIKQLPQNAVNATTSCSLLSLKKGTASNARNFYAFRKAMQSMHAMQALQAKTRKCKQMQPNASNASNANYAINASKFRDSVSLPEVLFLGCFVRFVFGPTFPLIFYSFKRTTFSPFRQLTLNN